jgi:hypothetical protein
MTTQPDHYATLERAIERYGDRALREMRRVWFGSAASGSAASAVRVIDPKSGEVIGIIKAGEPDPAGSAAK